MLWLGALLSTLAGLSLGLLGGGGSMLTLPILVYVLGVEPRSAVATSLVIVGTTSLAGTLSHSRQGRVQWRTGVLFGAAGMLGAAAGAKAGRLVEPRLLLALFGAVVVATSVAMLRPRRPLLAAPALPSPTIPWRVLRDGVGVGALTGLVGAGGGFLIVPALVLLTGLEMPLAVGTSLLVITLNALSALTANHLAGVPVDWTLAALMALGSVGGSLLGARLGRRLSAERLRQAFGAFAFVLGLAIVGSELSPAGPPLTHRLVTLAWVGAGTGTLAWWWLRRGRSHAPQATPGAPPVAQRVGPVDSRSGSAGNGSG